MAIHSFLRAERGDPDWQFSPEEYFGKQFKVIDASVIELLEGSTESVVLRQSPTEKELLAKQIRINVQKGATLELIIMNDLEEDLQQIFLYDINLEVGATMSLGIFATNGKFNKHIVQVTQDDSSLFGTYGVVSNTVQGDTEIITKILHQGAGSSSNQMYLGLAGKDSQTVFQSIVVTDPEAVQSQISIENSNLIIGENGRCYSKPETYINSEFVKSSQWSETDTINSGKITYLQSKGIPEIVAREIVINSFRNMVLQLISSESIQDEIKETLI